MITFVVSPLDHFIFPLLQLPVKLVELPAQIVPGLPEVNPMLGAAGVGLTVTLAPAEAALVQVPILQVTV